MESLIQDSDYKETRLYLLGQLTESEREQFEQRLLTEPTLHEGLIAVEDELVDEYLTSKLNEDDRRQFEVHFAITAERQNKIQFGRAFHRYLDSRQIVDPQEERQTTSVLPGFLRRSPVWFGVGALAICLSLLGTAWLIFQPTPHIERPSIAVTLRPGMTRAMGDSVQKVRKPAANTVVRLQLELGTNEYKNYRAELLRESESLATFQNLAAQPKDNHYAVDVIVDMEMEEGDYRVKLSGVSESGQVIPREEYGFRVED
jgi:hypothetical protein